MSQPLRTTNAPRGSNAVAAIRLAHRLAAHRQGPRRGHDLEPLPPRAPGAGQPSRAAAAYTLGLGLIAAILFVILTVTGLALMLYYVPYPPEAYRSMKDLQFVVTFGIVLRNMHRWAAHAMVVVVFLHMCRVFCTGAYKPPREFNWVIGVAPAAAHAGAVLHRLPAAVGPARVLGDHGRHQHRRLRAGRRRAAEVPAARRTRDRPDDAAALLRAALRGAAARDGCARLAAHLARAQGRPERRGEGGRPRSRRRPASSRPRRKTYGLMALTRRPRASVEARDPEDEVFAWPHLLYRELLVALGRRHRAARRLARLHGAARGDGGPDAHAEPGQGALVLPRAAGAGALLGVRGRRARPALLVVLALARAALPRPPSTRARGAGSHPSGASPTRSSRRS